MSDTCAECGWTTVDPDPRPLVTLVDRHGAATVCGPCAVDYLQVLGGLARRPRTVAMLVAG